MADDQEVVLDTLRENYDVLVENLPDADLSRLVSGLFARHCLTEYEKADISEGAKNGYARRQLLVDCLLRRGPRAFNTLCDLMEGQRVTRSLSLALKEAAARPAGSGRRVRDDWNADSGNVHQLELGPSADQRPSQRDLNHVGVTAEWRQLGVELGVSTVTLDEVEYDHKHGGIREVRSKMFEAWLKEGDQQQVTWRTLIRALEQIGLADKAEAVVVDNDLRQ